MLLLLLLLFCNSKTPNNNHIHLSCYSWHVMLLILWTLLSFSLLLLILKFLGLLLPLLPLLVMGLKRSTITIFIVFLIISIVVFGILTPTQPPLKARSWLPIFLLNSLSTTHSFSCFFTSYWKEPFKLT